MIVKDNKKINPIISDKEAKNTKVNLQTTDGQNFGEVSASAYSAIRGDYLDKYSPVDDNEKKVLDSYKKHIASLYPETETKKEEPAGRDANFWDLTINSLKRGYVQSLYGQESYKAMTGQKNNKAFYEEKLKSEDYSFVPDAWYEKALSGAMELLGQQWKQWTDGRSLAAGTAAAGAAALAGQAGPQIAAPEEVVTVPGAFFAGIAAGSATANFEIEAGLAYNEMVENGISPDLASKIALGVGVGNAALEMLQIDDLAKSFKILNATDATQPVAKKIASYLAKKGVHVATETAQEAGQEAVTLMGIDLGRGIEGKDAIYTWKDVGQRMGETVTSSAMSFGLLGTGGDVINYTVDKTANAIANRKKNTDVTATATPVQTNDVTPDDAAVQTDDAPASPVQTVVDNAPVQNATDVNKTVDDADIEAPAAVRGTQQETVERINQEAEEAVAEAENVVENTPEVEAVSEPTAVSVGDVFKDTKYGNTITVVERDDENTTIEINTGKGTEQRVLKNEQADTLISRGQYEHIEAPAATTEKRNISLTKIGDFYSAFNEDAVELADKLGLKVVETTRHGEPVKLVGFPVRYLDSYASKLGDGYNFTVEEQSNVTSVNPENVHVSTENTPENAPVANIDVTKEDNLPEAFRRDEDGKIRFNQVDIDYTNTTMRKGQFKTVNVGWEAQTVDGFIRGKYGVHKNDKAGKYVVTLLQSGMTVKTFDKITEAKKVAAYLDDNLSFNDVSYTKRAGNNFVLEQTDEFKAYLSEAKKILDNKEYETSAPVDAEIQDGKVPFHTKAELVEYVKAHKGDSVRVTFDNGISEVRTLEGISNTNLRTKKTDGSVSNAELKGVKYNDTGFSIDYSTGVSVTYDFVNVTDVTAENVSENTEVVPENKEEIAEKVENVPVTEESSQEVVETTAEENQTADVTLTDKCTLTATKHTATGDDIWVISLNEHLSKENYSALQKAVKSVGGYFSRFAKSPDGKSLPGFVFKSEPGADVIGVFNDFFASETETSEPVSTEAKAEETPEPLKNSAESDTIKETDNKESVEDVHTAVLERKNTDLDSGIQSEDAQSSEKAGHVERESGNVSGRSSVTDDISAPKYETDESSEESDPGRTVNNGVGERNDSVGDDRGNDDFDNQISDTVEKAPAQSKPKNYSMTKDVAEYIDKKPPSKEDNLEAIRVLHELENTGKKPTKAQLEALAKYKGWGGLSSAFLSWQIKDLEAVMTEEEIKAARATVEDAYYTPTYIIDAVYKALNRLGFEGGNVLEPSMGIGNFFAKMPKKVMEASKLFGVEIDGVSGRIASYLYPDAQITIDGFQNTAYKDGSFDLVVGNVPFGDVKYSYKGKKYLIHDFFFRKSLDKVADGGLMVFITSKGTMDKADYSLRAELASQADLVAAYRLPSSVFDRSAGASVATDIIILQKKENGSTNGVNFKNVGEIDGIAINEYFVEHPENIIGELTLRTNQFGKPVSTVKATGDVSAMLTKAMNKLPKGLLNGVSTTGTVDVTDYTGTTQHYTENGKNVEFVDSVTGEVKTITGKKATIAKDYIRLRDTYNELISASLNEESTATIENLRKKLKADYAAFKSKHGYVTEHKGTLADDVDFVKVSGLEVYDTKTKDYIMSEVFEKDTLTRRKPTKADNALDALGISIGEIGKVDVKLIAQLVGKTENEVLSELADKIILTPDGTYELNEVYLSGNIREKLRQVEGKKGFEKNAEMLKAVMPEEIKAKDISPQFGAPWISPKYIADFLRETFELYSTPKVNYDSTSGTWSVEQVWGNNTLMTKKYGTSYQDAMKIAEKALNMRKIIIKDRDGITLVGETRAAQQKADDIRNAFEEWCFKDTDRRNDLVRIFNEKFNSHRSMDFSELAEYLTFDGMSETFKLRDYQRRAVARTVFNGNTLLAHGVGTGKTAEMIASAMELKRLGVVKKNLMVVPNHKTADFRNDILKMYPSAKVIVLDKGAKVADRQKFFSQVASGDWDICIVPHSSFALLDVTTETKRAFIQNQIDELEDVLTQAQADKGKTFDGRFVRQLENQKKKLQAKLEDVTNAPKDKGMVFEELGVDSLFVDEAHNFKSLPFYTKLGRVAGVASTESTRAENMFMITDYINHTGGRVNFATATPITNSMTEIYNMIRFLRPEILKDAGISSFDAWASMFGSIVNEAEIDPTGRNMRMKERFSKFKNVSQMVEQFRRMADILKTGDVIQTLPDVERIDVINESNELQEEFLDVLDGMVAEIQSGGQKDATLNMLTVTKAGQMAAIDLRMIHSFFEGKYSKEDLEVSGNRTSKAAERIYKEYKDSDGIKGTQFVFCDYGIHDNPGARYDFNVYNDLINKLVAAGIPREEIAVAQDFKDKAELSGKVNTGEIRVLIGSTQVMGEGMNAQERAVALHHLTVPDRPSDIEQREGRIIRFGNINKNVRIYRYIQERSYDSYQWQMQERKASFINQALSNGQAAELEEMSDFVLTAREAKAIASGNPLLLEKMDVEDKLNKVRHARNRFNSDKLDMQDRMKHLPARIAALRKEITALKTDVETVQKNQSDDFKIKLYGKTFTERSAAAESLDVLLAKVPKNGEYVKIGEYLGLDVLFSSSIQHGRKFALKGAGTYTVDAGDSALGNITRLTNLANKLADEALQKETIAGVFEKELKTLEKEVKAEFPQAKELEELQAKLDEINTQIGADNEKDMSTVIVDDTPEDGGSPGGVRSSRDLPASASTYENYTYDALTRKDDMFITTLDTESVRDEKGKLNRDDVVKKGLENVRAKNNPKNTNENAYVYIPDVDRDVLVGKRGLTHGLSRNADATALVTTKIGDVLENAIRVNELYPRKNTAGGYILLGLAKDENKNYYPVRVVVNKHSTVEEVEVLDVLYAVNAKKKNQSSNEAELPADAVPPIKGSSTISIADLLEIVKDNFSDVLTDDVLETLGVERTESSLSEDLKFYHEADSSADYEHRWNTESTSDTEKTGVTLAGIIKSISESFGIPIATGKVTDREASGIYKSKPETVRTRITNNLPTVAHELGHHLDKLYNLSKLPGVKELKKSIPAEFLENYKTSEERDGEAVAEFIRVYLKNTNEANKLCPEFYNEFIRALSSEDLTALNNIASAVNEYLSYDLSERYDAAIVSSQKKEKLSFREKWQKLYTNWVDAFHPQKEAMDYVEAVTGEKATGQNNAYVLATNSMNAHTRAHHVICEEFCDLNGNVVPGAKSFVDSIGMVDSKDVSLLDKYLVLKHSLEWIAPEQDDVQAKRVFADDTLENVEEIKKQIAAIESEHPEIKTAADNLYEYQNNILKHFVIPAGGMTLDTMNTLNRKYPNYVPFYRAIGKKSGFAKGTFANQRTPIMRAKGSGAEIISPVESIIRNTEKMVKFAMRNQVMQAWAYYADNIDGFGQFMERVPPDLIPHFTDITGKKEQFADALQQVVSSGDDYFAVSDLLDEVFGNSVSDFTPVANANKKIVTVLENGKPSYYQIHDDAFYESVAELSPKQTSGLLKVMNSIMQPMKLLITQNNPIFAMTNALRDIGTAYKLSPINSPVDFATRYVKALAGVIKNSEDYKKYKAMGGGHSSELTANIENISKTLRKVAEKDMGKARRLARAIFLHPVETVASLNDAVESVPRFMEFVRTLETDADLQEAIFNASDITTNFKRSGKGDTAKAVNKLIMFNNAAIQGLDKTFRTFATGNREDRYKTLLKWLLHAFLMSVIGFIYNKAVDDEGYENLSTYKKNNFYNFAIGDGKFISLPKPRENALLDSVTERALEYAFGNDEAFYDFGNYVGQQMLPPMLPDSLNPIDATHSVLGGTIFGGLIDVGFNKDFKDTPIESAYDSYIDSHERYTESTTKLAYGLGQTKLARDLDLSPKKIDHLISSYTGIFGQINKALLPMNSERRDVTLGLRNKFISDSNYSTDMLNILYDNKDKAEKQFNYSGSVDDAVTYEQNAIITSYISSMNKAVKALPAEEQRNGRSYLLKTLRSWNYDNTASQTEMLNRFAGESVSDGCVITSVPKSTLEWSETKKDKWGRTIKGSDGKAVKVKYSYQMTPQEYSEYITDYLNLVEKYRLYQGKQTSNSADYTSALEATKTEVNKVLSKKYQSKYSGKATKTEQ